ncbi:MAG: sigma-70 family RNA polymerase sigma factor, partial [Bacteroidetes bacterium]|nr:sigma-70 family RNA polymerase sigma factor [Bacteroidota bacterium]
KGGNQLVIKELYLQHQQACMAFLRKHYQMSNADAADIYQDTILALYENILSGRLQQLESNVKTYILAIAKNLSRKKFNSGQKEVDALSIKLEYLVEEESFSEEEEVAIQHLETALNEMGEPCSSILKWFYYKKMGLAAIAQELRYQSVDVAKTQKSRCMKQLKKAVNK